MATEYSRCPTITETQANMMPLQTAEKCGGDSSVRDNEKEEEQQEDSHRIKESWEDDDCGNSSPHRVVDKKYFEDNSGPK